MIRRLLILLALLLAPVARAGARHRARAGRRRAGPARRRGRARAPHAHQSRAGTAIGSTPATPGCRWTSNGSFRQGFAAGPLRYPVPSRLTVAGIMNYVYDRDYAVLVRLKVPAGARGVIPIRAQARWLACTDRICVPEQGDLSLDLPVGGGTPNRAQFDAWRRALPQPLATVGRFATAGGKLRVAIPLPASVAVGKPYLFPVTDNVVDYEAEQDFRRSGDWLVAELKATGAPPRQFAGVLALGDGRGLEFHAVPGIVPEGGRRSAASARKHCWWRCSARSSAASSST